MSEQNGQPVRLSEYIRNMGISKADFASQLGVTREAVRAWCAGQYQPSLLHVSEMERLTGGVITARSFYSPELIHELTSREVANG